MNSLYHAGTQLNPTTQDSTNTQVAHGITADDFYVCFRRTPAEDFYKKPVRCAAHVVGIADPVMYRKRLETVQAIQRQQEDWNVRLQNDEPGYPVMYGNNSSYNSQGPYNKELKLQREKEKKEKLKDEIRAIQHDRRKAEDTLAYERAKFHADCAARNIRTTEDAERAWIRRCGESRNIRTGCDVE